MTSIFVGSISMIFFITMTTFFFTLGDSCLERLRTKSSTDGIASALRMHVMQESAISI
jgi:hypothetical protein